MTQTLRADQSGMALIYATVLLPVVIGFALLAVDVGRFTTLNSSLQHGADALALAGAAELDGRPDSIDRAESAMAQFITDNTALFTSSSVADVDRDAVTPCYFAELPPTDGEPIQDCRLPDEADQDFAINAKFVRVIVQPKTYSTIFPATFVGALSNTASTSAEAVAGFQAAVCNFTPLFMCNPFEPTTGLTSTFSDYGLSEHVSDPDKRKRAIRFLAVATGQTSTAVPGQFGFLDPVTGNGKKALGDEIASVTPGLCFIRNKIATKSGSMTDLRNAFNTRFDMYFGNYKKGAYPPATNVRKGFIATGPNTCNQNQVELNQETTGPVAIPVDSCFGSGTCSTAPSIGDGDWGWDPELNRPTTFNDYWTRNFGSAPKPSPEDLGLGTDTTPYSTANPPPRYDLYKYENQAEYDGKNLREIESVNSQNQRESGTPSCSPGNAVDSPDRRIIYGAIVNCRAENLAPGNGEYTAVAFGKFFMIRPMPATTNSELWLELVDVVRPGDGTGVARDMVQLYR